MFSLPMSSNYNLLFLHPILIMDLAILHIHKRIHKYVFKPINSANNLIGLTKVNLTRFKSAGTIRITNMCSQALFIMKGV